MLKWDARNDEKGKHGKFENLWKGPFKIATYRGQNAFLLKEMKGEECPRGPINGWPVLDMDFEFIARVHWDLQTTCSLGKSISNTILYTRHACQGVF